MRLLERLREEGPSSCLDFLASASCFTSPLLEDDDAEASSGCCTAAVVVIWSTSMADDAGADDVEAPAIRAVQFVQFVFDKCYREEKSLILCFSVLVLFRV